MVGPIMIRQKKEQSTYKVLVDHIVEKMVLSNAFLEVCPDAKQLMCFNNFFNNIKHHLQSVGVSESDRRSILSDIFGQQVGSVLEEGIVDADDEDEFDIRVSSLESAWVQCTGDKGKAFFHWFMKHKVQLLKDHLLKPVCIEAGLGKPTTTLCH